MTKENEFEYISYINEEGKVIKTNVPLKKDDIYYLSGEEKYWLFSSGKSEDLFESFDRDGLIGIGWDKISLEEIQKNTENELKELFKKKYAFLEKRYNSDKGFVQYTSLTVNKLRRFVNEINLGDIIVLKDRGKNQIKFGKVISEAKSSNDIRLMIDDSLGYCNKIRKVKWMKTINKDETQSELRLALTARHAVSMINEEKVKEEVNREIFSLFYRNNNLHMVFRVEKETSIDFDKFNEFQNVINELKQECLKKTKTENRLNIKTNVQSPGPIEYFGNPEIIQYIYDSIETIGATGMIGVMGTVGLSYTGLKKYLKLKEPQKRIDDGTSQGN